MAYEYKNPWGAGGKFYPPKWQDDKWVASAEGARKEAEERAKEKEKNSEKSNKVTKESLGISSSNTVEENTSILISNKMKIGDYLEGSQLDFIHKDAFRAINKFKKTGNNNFKITDITFFAKFYIDTDNQINISKGESNILIKQNNESFKNTLVSGLWIKFTGMKLDGYESVFLNENDLYAKEKGNQKYLKRIKKLP